MHRISFNHTSIQSRMKALNCKFVIKANNDMIQKVTLCKKEDYHNRFNAEEAEYIWELKHKKNSKIVQQNGCKPISIRFSAATILPLNHFKMTNSLNVDMCLVMPKVIKILMMRFFINMKTITANTELLIHGNYFFILGATSCQ